MPASSPSPSMLTDQLRQSLREAQDQVNALVLGAPVLLAATGLALVVALARRLGGRG